MVISISRCCGPQNIEKRLTNHKKLKKVNTKCDFRQFRLNSKSYNFAFCVFFVFLTDRKCRPLSSFSKSGGFGWVRNVIYERQILLEVFGFLFQFWSRSGSTECSRIRGVPFVLPIDESCGFPDQTLNSLVVNLSTNWWILWFPGQKAEQFGRKSQY